MSTAREGLLVFAGAFVASGLWGIDYYRRLKQRAMSVDKDGSVWISRDILTLENTTIATGTDDKGNTVEVAIKVTRKAEQADKKTD
jgi:hypothetical protein